MSNSITFIGGGNMATAIIAGLLADGLPAGQIEVVDPSSEACTHLSARFGVTTHTSLDLAAVHPLLVLAVKPQQMPAVAALLAGRLKDQLVISIAAGIRCADLSRWLGGHGKLVRTMPNTPAMVGAGITGLYASAEIDAESRSQAEAVLRAVGAAVWVERESDLDWVTAISGSGPAYVFYFIEALEQAARAGGLAPETARHLALHTVFGAAKLALEAGEEPAVLRARVTSKGGTTERALASMAADDLAGLVTRAAQAAAARSAELGDELGKMN